MPASRSSLALLLPLRILRLLKNPLFFSFGITDAPELNSTFSSTTSSDSESALRMSERLCIVVEQLICPPMKKATLPSELNRGAVGIG